MRFHNILIVLVFSFFISSHFANATRVNTGFYNNEKGSPLFALLQGAKKQIDIEIYTMTDSNIINLIRSALQRGVKVRIVQEPAPYDQSNCFVFQAASARDNTACADQKKLVRDVIQAGGVYVPFRKNLCGSGATNCFEHGKIAIIDQSALVSTGNFNGTNLCDLNVNPGVCNRDYTYAENSPNVVYALEAIFQNDLVGANYNLPAILTQYAVTNTLEVSPYSMDPLVQFIASAKQSIILQNQYVNDPTLVKALIQAAKRGVKVQVMVSSLCSYGAPKPNDLKYAKQIYSQFDQAGIISRFFSSQITVGGIAGYLHAKSIVVDQSRAWVGSVNGSTMALVKNREFGVFFNTAGDVQSLLQIMNADFVSPGSETFAESAACAKDSPTSLFPQAN